MPGIKRYLLAAFAPLVWVCVARAEIPCGTWDPVSMPAAAGNALTSVSATSATDAWAVSKALYHWDGSNWRQVSAPGLGSQDTVFEAVAAIDPADAWTVGYVSAFGTPQTLAEHWDGSAWSIVPSPMITGGSGFNTTIRILRMR